MRRQGFMVQIMAKEHIDLAGGPVGIKKRKNQRMFFVDNMLEDLSVQEAPRVDWHSRLEAEALHDSDKLREIRRIRGNSNVNIHGDPLHTMQHTGHSAANNKINIVVNQSRDNFLVVAHFPFRS